MSTNDLSDLALDLAAAQAAGQPVFYSSEDKAIYMGDGIPNSLGLRGDTSYSPSTEWTQGGPLIEAEGIDLFRQIGGRKWSAEMHVGGIRFFAEGKSPLIAATRCFVASRLGYKFAVPEEMFQ